MLDMTNESITISLERYNELFTLLECIERDHKTIFECRNKDDAFSAEKLSFAMTNLGVNARYALDYLKGRKMK